jgi:hypothetical protein
MLDTDAAKLSMSVNFTGATGSEINFTYSTETIGMFPDFDTQCDHHTSLFS